MFIILAIRVSFFSFDVHLFIGLYFWWKFSRIWSFLWFLVQKYSLIMSWNCLYIYWSLRGVKVFTHHETINGHLSIVAVASLKILRDWVWDVCASILLGLLLVICGLCNGCRGSKLNILLFVPLCKALLSILEALVLSSDLVHQLFYSTSWEMNRVK